MSNDDSSLMEGEIGRRAFLRRSALAGALIPGVPALLAGLAGAGCGGSGGDADGEKVLGFAHPDATGAFYPPVFAGAQLAAKELGWKVRQSYARSKVDVQVSEIQTWIAEGVDALTILALDARAVNPLVNKAKAKDITVVAYGNPIPGANGSLAFADHDAAILVGTAAGKWINAKLGGKAKVAFMGDYSTPVLATRLRDAKPALLKTAPGANIVYEGKGLLAPEALSVTKTLLQRHPDLQVVICAADDGAIGCSQAFVNAQVDVENVWVAGYDGSEQALEKAITGKHPLRAVAALDLVQVGRHVVSVPDQIIRSGGKKRVDWRAPYTLVTSDNRAAGERLIRSFAK